MLPHEIATQLMLACVRQKFDLEFCVQTHAIEGAMVTGIKLCKSNQEFPLTISCPGARESYGECLTPVLTINDLVVINNFRQTFSEFLERAETLSSPDAVASRAQQAQQENGHRSRTEADACVFVDRDANLIRALNKILSGPRGGREYQTSRLDELLDGLDPIEFIHDIGPLTPQSYSGRGQNLLKKLQPLSPKRLSCVTSAPVFRKCSDCESAGLPFLAPLCIAGVAEGVRNIRSEVGPYDGSNFKCCYCNDISSLQTWCTFLSRITFIRSFTRLSKRSAIRSSIPPSISQWLQRVRQEEEASTRKKNKGQKPDQKLRGLNAEGMHQLKSVNKLNLANTLLRHQDDLASNAKRSEVAARTPKRQVANPIASDPAVLEFRSAPNPPFHRGQEQLQRQIDGDQVLQDPRGHDRQSGEMFYPHGHYREITDLHPEAASSSTRHRPNYGPPSNVYQRFITSQHAPSSWSNAREGLAQQISPELRQQHHQNSQNREYPDNMQQYNTQPDSTQPSSMQQYNRPRYNIQQQYNTQQQDDMQNMQHYNMHSYAQPSDMRYEDTPNDTQMMSQQIRYHRPPHS